jgi:hypothetical protein
MSDVKKPVKLIVDEKDVQEQYDSMRVVLPSEVKKGMAADDDRFRELVQKTCPNHVDYLDDNKKHFLALFTSFIQQIQHLNKHKTSLK